MLLKKELIIKAAIKILSKVNYQTMKTADIAREAAIAEGTIYRYFKSKKEIFVDIMKYFNDVIPAYFFKGTAKEKTIEENIFILVGNFFRAMADSGHIYKIYYKSFSEMEDDEIRDEHIKLLNNNMDRFAEMLGWAIEKGEADIKEEDIKVIAMTVWGVAEAYLKRNMLVYKSEIDENEMKKVVGIMVKILK